MFNIRTKDGIVYKTKDMEDCSVSEALETIYENYPGAVAELEWNNCVIPLLGHSIGSIYNSITHLLSCMKDGIMNGTENFLDNTFTAKWKFQIKNDSITIESYWLDVICTKDYLNGEVSVISCKKDDFINEWNKLLLNIKKDLVINGYNTSLEGFEYLDKYIDEGVKE